MKKLIIIMTLAIFATVNTEAQEVYKEILRLSNAVAKDKQKDIATRKIATFKVDCLNYMAMKTHELMPDSTTTVIDNQAYALYDFVNLYVKKLSEAKTKKGKAQILSIFKSASIQNRRFNDMDLGIVEAYLNNDKYVTQFSLDTDWTKAIKQVRNELYKKGL